LRNENLFYRTFGWLKQVLGLNSKRAFLIEDDVINLNLKKYKKIKIYTIFSLVFKYLDDRDQNKLRWYVYTN